MKELAMYRVLSALFLLALCVTASQGGPLLKQPPPEKDTSVGIDTEKQITSAYSYLVEETSVYHIRVVVNYYNVAQGNKLRCQVLNEYTNQWESIPEITSSETEITLGANSEGSYSFDRLVGKSTDWGYVIGFMESIAVRAQISDGFAVIAEGGAVLWLP